MNSLSQSPTHEPVCDTALHDDVQISIQGIQKRYGRVLALDDIFIDVQRGEFLTLLGPSGSGKTTLLMILAGFSIPSAGRLTSAGKDFTQRPAEKRNFGMVFQGYALFPHMSVAENIAFPLRIRGVTAARRRQRVEHMLETVGLSEHAHKKPHTLSGGQQQRVALARALVFEPEMLLLDEPFSALDKNLRGQLQEEMKRIHQEMGTTFVFVTHDQSEALALSSRIAIFNQGRLAQLDTPERLYTRPHDRFVAEFLGRMNLLPLSQPERSGQRVSGLFEDTLLTATNLRHIPHNNLMLGVRPEQLNIALSYNEAAREGFNCLATTLKERTYQGHSLDLTLTTPQGHILTTSVTNAHPAAQARKGSPLWLYWPVDDGIVIEA
ncbi:ABC transporter ATP-binding protein [Vreelandella boliviensis]|uniref:ABC transporter ATP-binding protein n=1 Tax=Vreelandella boliviensis LC1 TaxID=1072583 RepID=A0A265DTQ0_9GAMM|nr:ABC transporter ATP-binding protein [Halomonas boliviensis]EHJ94858.1 Spermidine/putrescine import ATP-binding protein PotA [Halomonas boliviensis LC1]OZT72704.1 ABC transporter ATP-binding protein [Halomonas boliviensis LC1]